MAKYSLKAAKRYARALFESCETAELVNAQKSLQTAVALLSESSALIETMNNPSYPITERLNAIEGVAQSQGVTEQKIVNLLKLLVEHKSLSALEGISELFSKMIEALKNELSVEISSAFDISSEEAKGFEQALQKQGGGLAHIAYKVDKNLLGGLKIRVGDKILDNSVEATLNRFAEELAR